MGGRDWFCGLEGKESLKSLVQQEPGHLVRVMGSRVMGSTVMGSRVTCSCGGRERGAKQEKHRALLGSGSMASSGGTAPGIAPG